MTAAQHIQPGKKTPLEALSAFYQVMRAAKHSDVKGGDPAMGSLLKKVADATTFEQFTDFMETGRVPETAKPISLTPQELEKLKGGAVTDNILGVIQNWTGINLNPYPAIGIPDPGHGGAGYIGDALITEGIGTISPSAGTILGLGLMAIDIAYAGYELMGSIYSVNTNGFNQESSVLGAGSAGVNMPGVGFERIRYEY